MNEEDKDGERDKETKGRRKRGWEINMRGEKNEESVDRNEGEEREQKKRVNMV